MKFQQALSGLLFVALLTLSACGGGGGGGSDGAPSADPGNQAQPGETVINGRA